MAWWHYNTSVVLLEFLISLRMFIPVKMVDPEGSLTGMSNAVDVLLLCQQCF